MIGFADEEGVRFGATLLGSRAVAGTFDAEVLEQTAPGVAMRRCAARVRPRAVANREGAPHGDVLAYAELHIEQGPVLEAEGLALGVVTAINGATRLRSKSRIAAHAGTVPMNLRRDALAAAAECVLATRRAPGARRLVATVGSSRRCPARPT